MKILWGIAGSFCNHEVVFEQLEAMVKKGYDIQVIMTENTAELDTRFGNAKDRIEYLEKLTGKPVLSTIVEAEKTGPIYHFDAFIIAPATGTVISKLANGIYDNPVTLSAKAMLRNMRNVIIAAASNDLLSISGPNLLRLKMMKCIYLVPLYQDDCYKKPNSMVSCWELIEDTFIEAMKGEQIQPILRVK